MGETSFKQAAQPRTARSASAPRHRYRDPNLTFHPEIRPSSSLRPGRTVDELSRGDVEHKEQWLERQRKAKEAEWKEAHPFRPTLVPPPRALAGVPAKLSLRSAEFMEHHQQRKLERQALARLKADQEMVRLWTHMLVQFSAGGASAAANRLIS